MAAPRAVKSKKNQNKPKKNRKTKVHLVFDQNARREFLTGFHKRKLQRKKEAKEKLERDLKEERKRLKTEAKEAYKKLVVSHKPIPELETLLKEEYEEDNATVRIEELSTEAIARENNWIGANKPRIEEEPETEVEVETGDEIPGMGLKKTKKKSEVKKFGSEKEVKKILKKEATKKVKKSKVFQMKNKIEKQKQKKKSRQMKMLKEKVLEKSKKRKR